MRYRQHRQPGWHQPPGTTRRPDRPGRTRRQAPPRTTARVLMTKLKTTTPESAVRAHFKGLNASDLELHIDMLNQSERAGSPA